MVESPVRQAARMMLDICCVALRGTAAESVKNSRGTDVSPECAQVVAEVLDAVAELTEERGRTLIEAIEQRLGVELVAEVAPGHWATEAGRMMAIEYATKRRADLAMGEMSDLELANEQYLVSREDLRLIHFQTAAKERIRWLSVQLAIALGHNIVAGEAPVREEMADIGEAFMEALNDVRDHPFMKAWAPADGPSEIIVDLLNALDDQAASAKEAQTKAGRRGPITSCGCPFDDKLRQGHRDRCPTLTALAWPDGAPKIAPVQGFAAGIPWSLQLEAYDAYAKRWSSQPALIDLDRRGCRGGFGVKELDGFIPGWRDRVSEVSALRARIAELESAASNPSSGR